MQAEHNSNEQLDACNVIEFLKGNPDFFNHHSDVLSNLQIPHDTGGAVSLIEKQVSVFRRKCSALEDKLGELISVARENEQLHKRLHHLIQEIITASTIDDVIELTKQTLIENFKADDVQFLMIDSKAGNKHSQQPDLFVPYDDPGLNLFEENFNQRTTSCAVPTPEQRHFLFNDNTSIGSIAVIPLQYSRDIGLVVLSSTDARRFGSNKGVMFLNELGEVLSRRVATLL